jgi:hypothetical protein
MYVSSNGDLADRADFSEILDAVQPKNDGQAQGIVLVSRDLCL